MDISHCIFMDNTTNSSISGVDLLLTSYYKSTFTNIVNVDEGTIASTFT